MFLPWYHLFSESSRGDTYYSSKLNAPKPVPKIKRDRSQPAVVNEANFLPICIGANLSDQDVISNNANVTSSKTTYCIQPKRIFLYKVIQKKQMSQKTNSGLRISVKIYVIILNEVLADFLKMCSLMPQTPNFFRKLKKFFTKFKKIGSRLRLLERRYIDT